MLNNLLVVAGQVLTLFMMMAIGFILRKIKKLSDETLSQITFLLLYIVAPSIIIDSLQIERNFSVISEMGVSFGIGFAYFAVALIIAQFFYRRKETDTRIVLRFGTAYTNNGFMGLPLIRATLGDEAMLYAAVFLIVNALVQWTHGVIVMSGKFEWKSSLKKAFANPGMISFGIGLLFFAVNFRFPFPIENAFTHIGNLNSPIAMIIIGAQIADADIVNLFRQRELYLACFLKQVIIPGILLIGLLPLHLPPLIYCSMVILAGTPTAAMTAIFSRQFNRDTVTAARLVSLSTLLSILSLPVTAALAQYLNG